MLNKRRNYIYGRFWSFYFLRVIGEVAGRVVFGFVFGFGVRGFVGFGGREELVLVYLGS